MPDLAHWRCWTSTACEETSAACKLGARSLRALPAVKLLRPFAWPDQERVGGEGSFPARSWGGAARGGC